ncbi:MAG: hypothetical protein SGPRY_009845, partial [Prymnesium sp.]
PLRPELSAFAQRSSSSGVGARPPNRDATVAHARAEGSRDVLLKLNPSVLERSHLLAHPLILATSARALTWRVRVRGRSDLIDVHPLLAALVLLINAVGCTRRLRPLTSRFIECSQPSLVSTSPGSTAAAQGSFPLTAVAAFVLTCE